MTGSRQLPKAVSLAAGLTLLAVAAGFCVRTGITERDRVAQALGDASPGWLALGVALAATAMVVVATGWRRCLAALGHDRPVPLVARWFFLGELGKYVPGAVWPVVGRGELARRAGVDRPSAYHSVGLSLASFYGAAVLPASVMAAHPRVQAATLGAVRRGSGGRLDLRVVAWRPMVQLLTSYLPAWLCIAAVTSAVTAGYGASGGWQAPAATVLAWFCGFLAVPVPAGAGVREAVFVATCGLDPGLGLAVAVTTRLAFVVVDLGAAAVAGLAELRTCGRIGRKGWPTERAPASRAAMGRERSERGRSPLDTQPTWSELSTSAWSSVQSTAPGSTGSQRSAARPVSASADPIATAVVTKLPGTSPIPVRVTAPSPASAASRPTTGSRSK
jgi:glycosyltransferase 2 family protein